MTSVLIGMVLSFFIAGLGIAYTGKFEWGIGIILLWSISALVALYSTGLTSIIMGIFTLIIWSYSFVATFFLCMNSKNYNSNQI